MQILTNLSRWPESWRTDSGVQGHSLSSEPGAWRFFKKSASADLVMVMGDLNLILALALLYFLMPWRRRPIIAVDLVLREPRTFKQRFLAGIRRIMLRRVDHFIHYFKDLRGYERVYGIGPDRSSFVWFKCNLWRDGSPFLEASLPAGKFIVCAGKSLRDFDTFIAAIEGLPYPAAIAEPDFPEWKKHGARFTRSLDSLPKNLQRIPQSLSSESWSDLLLSAKVLVIPVVPGSLCASGISTYLDGMLLGRPVVITEGPGASDILQGEAIIVPEQNPAALREAIRILWEDQERRNSQIQLGRKLVSIVGGETELFKRLLEICVQWHLGRQ